LIFKHGKPGLKVRGRGAPRWTRGKGQKTPEIDIKPVNSLGSQIDLITVVGINQKMQLQRKMKVAAAGKKQPVRRTGQMTREHLTGRARFQVGHSQDVQSSEPRDRAGSQRRGRYATTQGRRS